jgi:hypothetical protein
VSSCPTNLFSLLPKVILTAPHLRFQQRFFSPGWVFAFPHLSGANAKPTFPQLNLHNTRVRRNPERLPSSRCIESAQSRRARVRILPIRASDTALRLPGTNPANFLECRLNEAAGAADAAREVTRDVIA